MHLFHICMGSSQVQTQIEQQVYSAVTASRWRSASPPLICFLMELSNVYSEKARRHDSKMMAPRLFAFIWVPAFSVALWAWRQVSISPRWENRVSYNVRRKQIIRTHFLSEISSDDIDLQRAVKPDISARNEKQPPAGRPASCEPSAAGAV